MALFWMQPGTRKQGVREQFPHSEESFAGVRAALAKAEVDAILLLVVLTEHFHSIVLTQKCMQLPLLCMHLA